MDLEKYKEEIGEFVRKARKEKGISLQQFTERYNIVAENTLIDLEKGRKVPKQEILDLVLNAIDKDMQDVWDEVGKDIQICLNDDLSKIDTLVLAYKYKEAKIIYDKLIKDKYYDSDNPRNKQSMAYYEGVFVSKIDKKPAQALKILKEGLSRRRPGLFCLIGKNGKKLNIDKINYDNLKVTGLSYIDYRMLSSIANIQFELGFYEDSIELSYSIVSSLNTEQVDMFLRHRLLDLIYFNFSTHLMDVKRYEEALEICNLGIALSKKIKVTRFLADLYSNKAEILSYQKNREEAHHYFKLAVGQFIRDDEPKMANKVKRGALDVHDIVIDI